MNERPRGAARRRPDVKFVRLVRVTYLLGEGVEGDPVREVEAYYDDEFGQLLFEVDPCATNPAPRTSGAPGSGTAG